VSEQNWFDFGSIIEGRVLLARAEATRATEELGVDDVPGREQISAGKGGRAYNAHSYPTKVPPEAIEPFIRRYSQPGDTVLDPFCGSGMTGLASVRSGRAAVLNDLSTLALHLAYNHTRPCHPLDLQGTWAEIQRELRPEIDRLYGVHCEHCHRAAQIRYAIWSDVYSCPSCGIDVPLWLVGLDRNRGKVSRRLTCPSCKHEFSKSAKHRDRIVPAWFAYACSCSPSLHERDLTNEEQEKLLSWTSPVELYYPRTPVGRDREMYKRSALHLQGISTVSDFYTPRNLEALARLWQAIGGVQDARVRNALAFAFTNTAWHGTRMRRYNARGGHRPLTGTLYIPQLSSEANVFEVFGNKIAHLVRFYAELDRVGALQPVHLHHGSATDLSWIEDGSVDYIFTDPPFGSNIFYADCNLIGEAWLGDVTNPTLEAVINRSRTAEEGGKSLTDYHSIMAAAFAEMHRVLKNGRWATVVFQSSDGEVWHSIERAAEEAGFTVDSAQILDKVQQSMKGYKGRSGVENVASFDIILHLHKAHSPTVTGRAYLDDVGLQQFALEVVNDHLARLPEAEKSERTLQFLYSLVVREILNRGFSVNGLTMEALGEYLSDDLQEIDGRWHATPVGPMATSSGDGA
jgi:16S rRNA G966 N2-methylase RsmD